MGLPAFSRIPRARADRLLPRAKGLVDKQYAEFLAVLGMAAETNTLANSLQIPVDREFLIS